MYDFVAYLMMLGGISTNAALPFWAQSNMGGIMPQTDGFLAVASANTRFDEYHKIFDVQWGASLAANDKSVIADELYLDARLFKYLRADVGLQHREREFLGADPFLGSLSTSEGHIVESNNARAVPGIALRLEPWAVPFTRGKLKLSGLWGDYRTTDDRFVDGCLIHRLRAYVRYDFSSRFYLQMGLDHYALWGGNSPQYGQMPTTFQDYLRVALGRSAGSSGSVTDQVNVIGDQGGAEQIRLGYEGDRSSVTFQIEKPYSDKSGMRLANFPDGQYTLHISSKDKDRWVSDVLIEYVYTKWQSGSLHLNEYNMVGGQPVREDHDIKDIIGKDDYFNNLEYYDGWTLYGRAICSPLFFTGTGNFTYPSYYDGVVRIANNRMKVAHAGLSGKLFRKAPYRLMVTCGAHYGTYDCPYGETSVEGTRWHWWESNDLDVPMMQLSLGFNAWTPVFHGLSAQLGLFYDCGKIFSSNFGVTLGIRYSL